MMKKELIISPGPYGFGHNWQLALERGKRKKVFFLGQDAKVCSRILGMSPGQVAAEIGSNDLRLKSTRVAICNLLLEAFNVTPENEGELFDLQAWELAAE